MSNHLVLLHLVDHICLCGPGPTDLVHVPSALQMAVWSFSLFRQDSHVGRSPRLTFSAPDDVNARNLPSEICPRRACHKYVSSLLKDLFFVDNCSRFV